MRNMQTKQEPDKNKYKTTTYCNVTTYLYALVVAVAGYWAVIFGNQKQVISY